MRETFKGAVQIDDACDIDLVKVVPGSRTSNFDVENAGYGLCIVTHDIQISRRRPGAYFSCVTNGTRDEAATAEHTSLDIDCLAGRKVAPAERRAAGYLGESSSKTQGAGENLDRIRI